MAAQSELVTFTDHDGTRVSRRVSREKLDQYSRIAVLWATCVGRKPTDNIRYSPDFQREGTIDYYEYARRTAATR